MRTSWSISPITSPRQCDPAPAPATGRQRWAGTDPPGGHHARARAMGRSGLRRSRRTSFRRLPRAMLHESFSEGRHDLHDRRLRRYSAAICECRAAAAAGSQQSGREGASAARRRHRAAGQSFRRARRIPSGDLHDGASQLLGLALHPVTGEIWENENGPNGGDEINVLQAGKNYGWPLVSFRPLLSRARASTRNRGRKGWSNRWSSGCPRSRFRA